MNSLQTLLFPVFKYSQLRSGFDSNQVNIGIWDSVELYANELVQNELLRGLRLKATAGPQRRVSRHQQGDFLTFLNFKN